MILIGIEPISASMRLLANLTKVRYKCGVEMKHLKCLEVYSNFQNSNIYIRITLNIYI
jgi:hypothetical protein